jgi:hypothetical protein
VQMHSIIYITFEHGWVGVVLSESSTVEMFTHCRAKVLNGTSPTSGVQ